MQIIIAPDSFKGSASAIEVANSIERGIKKVFKEAITIKIPIADGGEGTVEAIIMGSQGAYRETTVTGPLGEKLQAKYGILPDGSAVIEMAAASGITLIPEEKLSPMETTTYGPQKGADPQMIKELDDALRHYAGIIKTQLKKDILEVPGTGAVGGLGAGLLVFCRATLKSGIKTVLGAVNIEQYLKDTDIIITGEGRIDGQSIYGKVPVGVAEVVKHYDIPVIALASSIGEDASKVYDYNISSIMSILD